MSPATRAYAITLTQLLAERGALARVALSSAIVGCISVARGKHVGRLLIPLLIGVVLVAGWWFAYAVERAS